jgi:amidohydrolase
MAGKYFFEAANLFEYSQTHRRDFHRNPELGFREHRTAGIIASELIHSGLSVKSGVGGTGVVALLTGNTCGPVLLLRFDMDALPVQEETGAQYASNNIGIMHACGHDGHIAIGLTVARVLSGHQEKLQGRVKFVFQPAEEGLGGANQMIRDGILINPSPDYILALHLWNEKPVGWIGVTPGPMMAGSEILNIKLVGRGGHGALPHRANDSILASAHLITALQSIVSRNTAPLDSAVISITQIRGGETHNVIPGSVELKGTVRFFDKHVQNMLNQRIIEISNNIAEAFGCIVDVNLQEVTPPVVNDFTFTKKIELLLTKYYPELELDTDYQTMGSEDMALVMESRRGCYLLIGSANESQNLDFGHHHPKFDFDEAVLPLASSIMCEIVFACFESSIS